MIANFLNIIEYEKCTGCAACKNICPVGAIQMQEDEEGFLFPVVDENKCTNCGLCKKSCPILNAEFHETPEFCYAVMADDEIRMKSSSGGIFTVISEYILEQDGVVCGAAFDENWNVEHVIIDNKNDLNKLRGSKYVQSDVKNVYSDVKNILNEGKKVFFTGTPCQIAALYGVLGKDFDNLLTAEVVCHGVPNNKIWQNFLENNFDKQKIKNINFRDKTQYGWSCNTIIMMKDNAVINNQNYYDGFNQNLYLRNSCGNCSFTKFQRCADITFADFWGIWEINPAFNDGNGTSLLLLNSDKATGLFTTLKNHFKLFEKLSSSVLINGPNYPLYRSSIPHPGRKKFFTNRQKASFNENAANSLSKPFDVGLIGLWYAANYGGFLTYWALYKYLESNSYNTLLIDNCNLVENAYVKSGHRMMLDFIRQYKMNCSDEITNEKELYELNNSLNSFIIGSDQIWCYHLTASCYPNYFLNFANSNKNLIACASSFGHDCSYSPETIHSEIGYYLKRFDGISVRESNALDILKDEFGIDEAVQILDPVFYDTNCYEELIKNSKAKQQYENYLFSYCLDPTEEKEAIIHLASKKLSKEAVVVTEINPSCSDLQKSKFKQYIPEAASIEDWLYYIKNCNFVVTDSFHGVCFSIIYRKNFIAIANSGRGVARFKSILSQFGLTNRLVSNLEECKDNNELFEPIDYDKVYKILNSEKIKSTTWLLNLLKKDKIQNIFNTYDLYLKFKIENSEKLNNLHSLYAESLENFNKLNLLYTHNCEKLSAIKNYNKNKLNYFRVRLLQNITFGKTKQHYMIKKHKLKYLIKLANT